MVSVNLFVLLLIMLTIGGIVFLIAYQLGINHTKHNMRMDLRSHPHKFVHEWLKAFGDENDKATF